MFITKELIRSLDGYISENYDKTDPADKTKLIEKISGFLSIRRFERRKCRSELPPPTLSEVAS